MKYFDTNAKPGFFLLYELFTGALPIVVLPSDTSRDMASILMSVLNDDSVSGIQSVILRVLECHQDLSPKMPPFEDRRKMKLPKLTGLDIFQVGFYLLVIYFLLLLIFFCTYAILANIC
jgi:hypothetical protein